MSFIKNKNQQITMDDNTYGMTKRSQRILKKSWAEHFSQLIFPLINEDRFAVLYSDNPATRPNTPVNVIVGMLILKEIYTNSHLI